MKVKIEPQEWWPVLEIKEDCDYGKDYEIEDYKLESYRKLFKDFEAMQLELREITDTPSC